MINKNIFVDTFETLPKLVDGLTPQGRVIPTTLADVNGLQATPMVGANQTVVQLPTKANNSIKTNNEIVNAVVVATPIDLLSTNPNILGSLGERDAVNENNWEQFSKLNGPKDVSISKLSVLSNGDSAAVSKTLDDYIKNNRTFSEQSATKLKDIKDYLNKPVFTLPEYDSAKLLDELQKKGQEVDLGIPSFNVGGIQIKFCPILLPRLPKLPKFTTKFDFNFELPKPPKFDIPEILGLDGFPCIPVIPSLTDQNRVNVFKDRVKKLYNAPENLAAAVDKELAIYRDALLNNINGVKQFLGTPIHAANARNFEGITKGTTPPIAGAYGGPNYGGTPHPHYAPPTNLAENTSKYSKGSKDDVKSEPPPDWKGDRNQAKQNIELLLGAASQQSFTNEQKATLLAIIGVDNGWKLDDESPQFTSIPELLKRFSVAFKGDHEVGDAYVNWSKGGKGQKEDFWNFVHDTCNQGRKIGNTQPGDGAKYVGRGFIKIAGRSNYFKFEQLTKAPLIDKPELLNDNPPIAATVAVLLFLERVKTIPPTAHPHFFYAAQRVVGNPSSGFLLQEKIRMYEWFYGTPTPESFRYTEKTAGTYAPMSYQGRG